MSIAAALQHPWLQPCYPPESSSALASTRTTSFASFISDATDATTKVDGPLVRAISRSFSGMNLGRPPASSANSDTTELDMPDTPMPNLRSAFSDASTATTFGLPGTYPNSMVAVDSFDGGLLPVDDDGNEYVPDSQPVFDPADSYAMQLASSPVPPHPAPAPMMELDDVADMAQLRTPYKRKASSPLSPLPEDRSAEESDGMERAKIVKPNPGVGRTPLKTRGARKALSPVVGRRQSERIKTRAIGGEMMSPAANKRRAKH